MKKNSIIAAFICMSAILMAPIAGYTRNKCPQPAPLPATLSGAVEITDTTTYPDGLIIADDAVITAPDDYSLTMTVNSVETPIAAGTYTGNVILTPTEDIIISNSYFRVALYVEDGKIASDKSVVAAIDGGKVTNFSANNVRITSVGPDFNGIYVAGDSTYTINCAKINFTGNGGNDFAGYGAAVASAGT
jgi:hypothetical protein